MPNIRERIDAAMPKGFEWARLGTTVVLALWSKAPLMPINFAVGSTLSEKFQENPDLIPLGLLFFGGLEALLCLYDYQVLKRDNVAASAKSSLIFKAFNFLAPDNIDNNKKNAEYATILCDLVGISPDISLFFTTVQSIITGDISHWLANRVSNVVTSGTFEFALNTGFLGLDKIFKPHK